MPSLYLKILIELMQNYPWIFIIMIGAIFNLYLTPLPFFISISTMLHNHSVIIEYPLSIFKFLFSFMQEFFYVIIAFLFSNEIINLCSNLISLTWIDILYPLSTSLVIGCLWWPLWSSIVTGFFGNYLGSTKGCQFAVMSLGFSLLLSFYSLFIMGLQHKQVFISLFNCFTLPVSFNLSVDQSIEQFVFLYYFPISYEVTWALLFDNLTIVMLIVITSISFLVHLYASSYMFMDPYKVRFFSCLSLFTFFMLMLVTAENYFQLFIGWEGVGLCSYLLITFWYTRIQANKSALQAVVVNKVGDFTLVLALLLLFIIYHDTSFQHIFRPDALNLLTLQVYIGVATFTVGELIGGFFLIGAVAKSAQIGLHTWLLSAMEGPTPVSALLHAATMVTAGIFLMIRSHLLLAYAPTTLNLMLLFGAITAFMAATCGLVQHDIKKIIAFSTCSQLGYMFYACGLSNFETSLYHLTNHAFFKALLFLCAGAIIHAFHGEQDIRRMGGLRQIMPVTYIAMLIASLSLLGFPFLSGFYSKDIIIELAWVQYTIPGTVSFFFATSAAFLTAFYSTRLLYLVFLSEPNGFKNVYKTMGEVDETMLWSFRPLIFGSIFCGYFIKLFFISFGVPFFMSSQMNNVLTVNQLLDSEFLPFVIKFIPIFFSFAGLILAFIFYNDNNILQSFIKRVQIQFIIGREIHFFLVKKWYFDIFYNHYLALSVYNLGLTFYQLGDQGFLELFGPQGIFNQLTRFKFIDSITAPMQYNTILIMISLLFGFFNAF